ncbi:hypothetical protein EW145_g4847 [Phellinidium pouzarii]|uniref:NADP-dependent oxidoreductase domain-containing protein n=1 Tax=Phellinidium pouzarii TaxID=167371 RepID=A0A4S4L216_9AGAM|nr:hypothetical protein EW145_g4847 [Phellinidium pouzarii]
MALTCSYLISTLRTLHFTYRISSPAIMASTRVPLLFGTMNMGVQGKNAVRNHDLQECQEIIDVFYKYGHKELDTARVYAEGTTEEYDRVFPVNPGDHHPAKLRATFKTSLEKLSRSKVRVLYLHAPDRSIAFEDTLREINALYNEGRFEFFGLSSYAAWEVNDHNLCSAASDLCYLTSFKVAEIAITCKKNGWIQPKIYQAMYNAITRSMESELVPCCRKYGLRIVIYNPLALPSIFMAVTLRPAFQDKHGLRLTEVALRWVQHHSVLTPEDGIVLGASSAAQLEQNCLDSEKGPLPDDVVVALDEACKIVGFDAPSYWR